MWFNEKCTYRLHLTNHSAELINFSQNSIAYIIPTLPYSLQKFSHQNSTVQDYAKITVYRLNWQVQERHLIRTTSTNLWALPPATGREAAAPSADSHYICALWVLKTLALHTRRKVLSKKTI
jgi:hypothetical protein